MPGFEVFGEEERREVLDVLETGVLMRYGFDAQRKGRWKARELEELLAARHGVPYAHVCSSGTAAVYTALACAGVGVGDEVIVPPFTFVADVEAILYLGAVPVFAEIDRTLNLDPAAVASAFTPRTRAVLLVHMCGSMAHVDRIAALCRERGVALIEDVAQAIGASYHGRPLGTFGMAGCFSFDYVKTVTCGEGGGVVTADGDLHERIQAFTDHGHDHRGADRGADLHPRLGLNFRISELHAAVGLAQLRKLDRLLGLQRRNKALLEESLAGLDGLEFREIPDPEGDSATFLSLFLPDARAAEAARAAMAAAGIDGCFYWYANNWHYQRRWEHFRALASPGRLYASGLTPAPAFMDPQLPRSDALMARTLSLQIRVGWDEDVCRRRGAALRVVLAGCL